MNKFAAFFKSGLVIQFTAPDQIHAEARAHHKAVALNEYLQAVIAVVDVSISEAA